MDVTYDSGLAVIDRLDELHDDLKKVEGTLAMILRMGNAETVVTDPDPEQFLSMLQLLGDVVTPVCDGLGAIVQEMGDKEAAPPLPQGKKARVKKKGR
jgi:hypothetical protein